MRSENVKRFINEAKNYLKYKKRINKLSLEIDVASENYHSPQWNKVSTTVSRDNSDTMSLLIRIEPKYMEMDYIKWKCNWIESIICRIKNAEMKVILIERYLEGMSIKYISEEHGYSIDKVKKDITKALTNTVLDEDLIKFDIKEQEYREMVDWKLG